MDFSSLDINATALKAQRLRMDTISSNLANVNSTRNADGTVGAYKRRQVVFAPILNQAMGPVKTSSDGSMEMGSNESLSGMSMSQNGRPLLKAGISMNDGVQMQGVQVMEIAEDQTPTKMVYNPGHPDANKDGYVEMPNINVVTEMVDMISATRAYEANATIINNYKAMFKSTIQI